MKVEDKKGDDGYTSDSGVHYFDSISTMMDWLVEEVSRQHGDYSGPVSNLRTALDRERSVPMTLSDI